jgi:hypothetical protein
MARGLRYQFYGKRYCGNTNKMEVHDFNYEDRRQFACQMDDTIASGQAKSFAPDTLEQAHKEGYHCCVFCIGTIIR